MCKNDANKASSESILIFSDIEQAMMQRALQLAKDAAQAGEVPVGAVVYSNDGKIIGEGHNQTIHQNDMTAHAEIVAMRQAATALANYRLSSYHIAVSLEPCTMCIGAILHARLASLIFAATDPKTGACGSVLHIPDNPILNHQTQIKSGLFADQSTALLHDFFNKKRQTKT